MIDKIRLFTFFRVNFRNKFEINKFFIKTMKKLFKPRAYICYLKIWERQLSLEEAFMWG